MKIFFDHPVSACNAVLFIYKHVFSEKSRGGNWPKTCPLSTISKLKATPQVVYRESTSEFKVTVGEWNGVLRSPLYTKTSRTSLGSSSVNTPFIQHDQNWQQKKSLKNSFDLRVLKQTSNPSVCQHDDMCPALTCDCSVTPNEQLD